MTLYHVKHPNGIIHVIEADSPQEAKELVIADFHEDALCDLNEFIVTPEEVPNDQSN